MEKSIISGLYYNDSESEDISYVGLFGRTATTGKIMNVGIENSYLKGKYIGGVCGNNHGTIQNCYFTGTVIGRDATETGGVCGAVYSNGTIQNCYFTGIISIVKLPMMHISVAYVEIYIPELLKTAMLKGISAAAVVFSTSAAYAGRYSIQVIKILVVAIFQEQSAAMPIISVV